MRDGEIKRIIVLLLRIYVPRNRFITGQSIRVRKLHLSIENKTLDQLKLAFNQLDRLCSCLSMEVEFRDDFRWANRRVLLR